MQNFSKTILFASSIVVSAALTTAVSAQNGDGTLNGAFYGSALAVQTINTGFGDAAGGNDSAGGSELDAAYGTISGGDLYLFLAGNFQNNGNRLNVFVSGGASGQSTLAAPVTGGLATMNGSVFSPGFQATWAYDMNDYMGTLYSEEYTYNGSTSLAGGYVGSIAETSTGIGAGTPSGGSFTAHTHLALNNNHASTMGAEGAAASNSAMLSDTTGLEMQIPLSVIGYAGGQIMVLADINGGGDGYLSNQFLPGLTNTTLDLGGYPTNTVYTGSSSGAFNFSSTPGEYFTVVPEPASVSLAVVGLLGAVGMIRRRKA